MNEKNDIQPFDDCIHNCAICPNREKKRAGNSVLFPGLLRRAVQADPPNEPAGCDPSKVDLSDLFGGEIFSARPALELASHYTINRKTDDNTTERR